MIIIFYEIPVEKQSILLVIFVVMTGQMSIFYSM